METKEVRKVSVIAAEIVKNLQPIIPKELKLPLIYMLKGGKLDYKTKLVINGFLNMASMWQGETADRIKAELAEMSEIRPLYTIAREIRKDWKVVNFAAKPYLDEMSNLDKITDTCGFGQESGKMIINYFLSNAGQWKGETAKRIKAELKEMVK